MKVVEKVRDILNIDKRKQLVFYFDENAGDNTFEEELKAIEGAGIKVASANDNYFELKYKLEMEWRGEPVFIYHPFKKPSNEELKRYPLLDLLIANRELKLDDVSEFLTQYNLSQDQSEIVRRYIKQLRLPTNQKKLSRILEKGQFDEYSLKRGLISINLGFSSVVSKNICMAKCFELALDKVEFEKSVEKLKNLELEEKLLLWFNTLYDTNFTDLTYSHIMEWASKLKYNLIVAPKSTIAKDDSYGRLKMERTIDITRLQNFYEDWRDHKTLKSKIEPVFEELGAEIRTENILKWYKEDSKFGYYTPLMLTSIINGLYKDALNNTYNAKQQSDNWRNHDALTDVQQLEVLFVYHATSALMILNGYSSFIFNTPEDFIKEYTTNLYKVDTNFRKAIIAYEEARSILYHLDDDAVALYEELNKRYDSFLTNFNVEWQMMLKDIQFDFHKIKVDKQFDFYKKHLQGFEYKMVVIVSDAFRYELGQELCNDLLEEGKMNVEVIPSLASVPSYTNLGMSNLLPNDGMTVEATDFGLSFRIDGKTTASTNRAAILQSVEPASATIGFVEAMSFDLKRGREFFRDNRIVYIYHDWIDAIGDKRGTQHETLDATRRAMQDIKALLGKLASWNVRHARVTSDHGFLYNHNEIKTHNRERLPSTKGFSREHVRFVVAEEFEGAVDGYQMDLRNTTNLDTDLKVLVPRATNRYHIQGNIGLQFVHGGASMQELLTPVLVVHRVEKDENETVSFKVIEKTDRIVSNFMKIKLLQDQPVSNELKNNELVFAIYSETGELLSDEVEVNLNSTSSNPRERVFDIVLFLNSKGSSSSLGRVKAFKKSNTMRINTDGLNEIVTISSLIEKDDF